MKPKFMWALITPNGDILGDVYMARRCVFLYEVWFMKMWPKIRRKGYRVKRVRVEVVE